MKTFGEKDVFPRITIAITINNRNDVLLLPKTDQRKTNISNHPFLISPSNCIHERFRKGSLP